MYCVCVFINETVKWNILTPCDAFWYFLMSFILLKMLLWTLRLILRSVFAAAWLSGWSPKYMAFKVWYFLFSVYFVSLIFCQPSVSPSYSDHILILVYYFLSLSSFPSIVFIKPPPWTRWCWVLFVVVHSTLFAWNATLHGPLLNK